LRNLSSCLPLRPDLLSDKRWSKERPLRVVTAYMNVAEQFFAEQVGTPYKLNPVDARVA
jgi:ATP phosphoribosyltransferase